MTEVPVDVFGWLADHSGCGTIRIKQPLDTLAMERGLLTHYDQGLSVKGQMPKIIVGQRVCKDRPSALWEVISKQPTRPKLVFEVDDDLWNIDPSNERAFEWFNKGIDQGDGQIHDVQSNLQKNVQVADRVTCTTEPLAELLRAWNDDVRVVPNHIPQWLTEYDRGRRDRLTVGWVGSSTHHMDWETASSEVRRFLNRNPHIDFKIVGAEYGKWLRLPEDQVIETGWFPNVEDSWRALDFDIGIAPLRPHVFNRSKSAIKFLEYAALGIPTIASDVGPYADNIKHGVTGLLVKYEHEWQKYLRELANDEAMRKELGDNARAWARTQTLEGNIDKWKEALCEW